MEYTPENIEQVAGEIVGNMSRASAVLYLSLIHSGIFSPKNMSLEELKNFIYNDLRWLMLEDEEVFRLNLP
jgi:hypothetical protein